jgi:hypothetical protein
MTEPQLVSQRVVTEIKLLLRNTLSECLIDNLTNSFHILTQSFILFFTAADDRQATVSIFIVSCAGGCPNKVEFSKQSRIHTLWGTLS